MEWDLRRLKLEDLQCLKLKVLEEADTLRLTQGDEEKPGVLAPVDVLKRMKKLKVQLAQGEENQERKMRKKKAEKESLLFLFNVELG